MNRPAVLRLTRAALLGLAVSCAAPSARAAEPAAADTAATKPYEQGRGLKLVKDRYGDLNLKLLTYFRYLNQNALDDRYTDSFGTEKRMDLRQDFQLTKMSINFFGWFMDPKLRYLAYVWTSNTSQGQLAQVVVAGNITYAFSPRLTVGGGIGALPTTRSTEGSWPNWLPVDNRLIADEYFRGSYTSGVWVQGSLPGRLRYAAMIGNNLSQLGIDAAQLDNNLDTWAAELAWYPTTGEFGKANGFGDYDRHDRPATRLGAHFTYSDENRQSQSNPEAIENSQIRLSDGNIIFTPGLFGPGIAITDLRFQMIALDAGVKYRGWSLEGEFFRRLVNDLRGANLSGLTFGELTDTGFQVLASVVPRPDVVQVYAGGSKIFGDYGDPSEVRGGVNVFPWRNKAIRWNTEIIVLDHSPTGNAGYPYTVGANGPVFSTSFELNF